MASADIGSIQVEVRMRSPFRRGLKLPRVFWLHFRTLRRSGQSIVISVYGAWLLCRELLVFTPSGQRF